MPEEGVNLKQMVEEFEKELIIEALEKTNGVKNQAATLVRIEPHHPGGKTQENENQPLGLRGRRIC